MKKIHIYTIFVLIILGFTAPDNNTAVWVVMPGSNVRVNGATNINSFACDVINYAFPDTLTCFKQVDKGQMLPMTGKLQLDVEAFDCHNKMMTNDLRKTLQVKTYPKLIIRFISINSFPDFKKPSRITGVVDISLSGVTKRFEIDYLFTIDSQQGLHLKGERNVNFSDFHLTPPSKLGGIIKAKDQLGVEFVLNLKPLG
jgi:hypothetical protein